MNTTSKSVAFRYIIFNGPSKSVLFDSCLYAYSKDAKAHVNFAVFTGLFKRRQ